jgi:hypothetical protein
MRSFWLALQWLAGKFAGFVMIQVHVSNKIQFYLKNKVTDA